MASLFFVELVYQFISWCIKKAVGVLIGESLD